MKLTHRAWRWDDTTKVQTMMWKVLYELETKSFLSIVETLICRQQQSQAQQKRVHTLATSRMDKFARHGPFLYNGSERRFNGERPWIVFDLRSSEF